MKVVVQQKKYLNQAGLAYFFKRIKEIFVIREEGKGLSKNDFTDELKEKLEQVDPESYLQSVTNRDDSVEVSNGREIAAKISNAEGNVLQVKTDEGEEGLYVPATQPVRMHKLTFGADKEYVYDGSEDVTVPVYDGTVDNNL